MSSDLYVTLAELREMQKVMAEGYGLRSSYPNYLPGPDDTYLSHRHWIVEAFGKLLQKIECRYDADADASDVKIPLQRIYEIGGYQTFEEVVLCVYHIPHLRPLFKRIVESCEWHDIEHLAQPLEPRKEEQLVKSLCRTVSRGEAGDLSHA